MKFTILVDHYYTLGFSDLCPGVEKKIFKEIPNTFLQYDLYGNAPAQEPPPMLVMKFTYLVCLINAWE